MHEVVVGALVRGGQVLLVHRRPAKHANPDVWDLPGGLVEAGESELDALARELQEELAVRVDTSSASHLCRLTVGPAGEQAVLSAWLVRDWQGTPANVAPEEHDGMEWFGLEELPPPPHLLAREALVGAMHVPPRLGRAKRSLVGASEDRHPDLQEWRTSLPTDPPKPTARGVATYP